MQVNILYIYTTSTVESIDSSPGLPSPQSKMAARAEEAELSAAAAVLGNSSPGNVEKDLQVTYTSLLCDIPLSLSLSASLISHSCSFFSSTSFSCFDSGCRRGRNGRRKKRGGQEFPITVSLDNLRVFFCRLLAFDLIGFILTLS